MRLLMLISDGMEECEALVTRDVLIRSKIDVVMFPTNGKSSVLSSHNLVVNCDTKKLNLFLYDGLILPGGGLGTKNLDSYINMDSILKHFIEKGKLVCAICAAPSVLGKRGYLNGKNFTCFSGFEKGINGNYTGDGVTVDGNIITAKSMYYSADFGLAIVKYLLGEEKMIDVQNKIMSNM